MIKIENLSKSYDDEKSFVVKNINMAIQTGEFLVLLGSSGSGKSTLLKMLNRLVPMTHGEVFIKDKNILDYPPEILRRSIGYVFQQVGLFPHLTVSENISVVLKLLGKSKKACRKKADELLITMALEPEKYSQRFPYELSGGQQQRIGVARALAANPDILLMDEPFGALDAITREDLQNELLKLKESFKKTVIFVTHDIQEAFYLADRIAVMHQGECKQIATPDVLRDSPATQFIDKLVNK